MSTIHSNSVVKNVLKNLCCSYGWSYGAFWSFDLRNSLLLTLQDAYFDENSRSLMDNLLLQVPFGGGLIGQAAFTNKHLWMSSGDHYKEQNFSGSIWDMFLDDYEFRRQFSSGVKTIAVIPVESQGVVQFGSNKKVPESMEFVNQTKRMFQEIVSSGGGSEIASCLSYNQNCQQNESFASLISTEESCFMGTDGSLIRPMSSSSALFDALPDFGIPEEVFQTGDFDVSQWFPPLKDDLLAQAQGFIPISSDRKRESLTISGGDVDLLRSRGDLGDILAPVIDCSYNSQCMSMPKTIEQVDCSALGPKERLFSKLGIEELLEGVSGISSASSASCIEGQISAKRRKTGSCIWEASSLSPVVYTNIFEVKNEGMRKSQTGLQMVDGSMSGSSTVVQAKKKIEPPKPSKKKAKPGTRPRPKDRQQILDRMAELRQLIPNGEKMSIDCLLDRTIKHMIFLQGVTKQAEKIKQAEEPKNGVASNDPSNNSVTWACELGNQTMVFPLIVEDLGSPGHMLIEMLCEERGFFLEIVDVIRRFGLIILKGVMESRTDKIWARFSVEAEVNRHVTRHELFTMLVQFLQTKELSNSTKECMDARNADFHQNHIQSLANLTDMQYCVNL